MDAQFTKRTIFPLSEAPYKYANGNPVNYVDPSGNLALIDYPNLMLETVAKAAAISLTGRTVACLYYSSAATLQAMIDAEMSGNPNQEVTSLLPRFEQCGAEYTVNDLARNTTDIQPAPRIIFSLIFRYRFRVRNTKPDPKSQDSLVDNDHIHAPRSQSQTQRQRRRADTAGCW